MSTKPSHGGAAVGTSNGDPTMQPVALAESAGIGEVNLPTGAGQSHKIILRAIKENATLQ